MKRLWLTAMLAVAASAADAATAVLFDSDPGDYIGGGQQQVFEGPTWAISYGSSTATLVQVSIDGPTRWSLRFELPRGATLSQPADYAGATRHPFNSATQPGLSVSGDGRGCNTLTGWFEVREALLDASGQLERLALDFRQNCEGGSSSLYGAVRINSEVPLDISGPHAIAGRDLPHYGRDAVILDGRQSFDRGSVLTYQWEQIAGRPVELRGASTSLADFTAPLVPPGGDDLLFRLTVRNTLGATDVDEVRVHVQTLSDPQTFIEFQSDPGDYIGGGRTFRRTPEDGDISAYTNYRGGVSMDYWGDDWYFLDFGPPKSVPFLPGPYEDAQRFAFAADNRPGMDVSGDGRGCNTISGRFDLLQVLISGGSVARFGLDFEQHCEGGVAALRGKARYNFIPPGIPVARAGPDQQVPGRAGVTLDGSASTDDQGLVMYQWRQVTGTPVVLAGADTAVASFTAPAETGALAFELLVADAGDLTAGDTVLVTVSDGSSSDDGGSVDGRQDGGNRVGALGWAIVFLPLLRLVVGRRRRRA